MSASTQSQARLALELQAREPPLVPCAALALGDAALRLARRLLLLEDERLGQLRGVASPRSLILLGAEGALPWVEGIAYFGVEPRAPGLLLPCALQPVLPIELVARALNAKFQELRDKQTLVCFAPPLVIDVSAARQIDRGVLGAWHAAAQARGEASEGGSQ